MCNYYIVIPISVKSDKRLSDRQKLLYGDIHGLAHKDGYCFASNKYLADMYAVTISTISRDISALESSGHIRIEIDQSKGNLRRIWALTGTDSEPRTYTHTEQDPIRTADNRSYKDEQDLYQKGTRPYTHTEQEVCAQPTRPIRTADKYNNTINNTSNNTVNNTTNNNARAKKNEDFEVFELIENDAPELTHSETSSTGPAPNFYEAAREVIKYLNDAAGFDIYPGAGKGSKLIIDRMQEGATYQDCCAVIDLKVAQTRKRRRDGDFIFKREWLYPTTLFKPDKFEKYLQEVKDLKNGKHQHAAPTTAAEIAEATRAYHKANGIDVSRLLFGHSSADD